MTTDERCSTRLDHRYFQHVIVEEKSTMKNTNKKIIKVHTVCPKNAPACRLVSVLNYTVGNYLGNVIYVCSAFAT